MSHRKLTEQYLYAMQSVAPRGDVYNRLIAAHLRAVEKFFPGLIEITPPPHCDHVGARPLFGVIVTERGLSKLPQQTRARVASRHVTHEARP
jgi:hypothetical protein